MSDISIWPSVLGAVRRDMVDCVKRVVSCSRWDVVYSQSTLAVAHVDVQRGSPTAGEREHHDQHSLKILQLSTCICKG